MQTQSRASFLSSFPPWVAFKLNELLLNLKSAVQLAIEDQLADQENEPEPYERHQE